MSQPNATSVVVPRKVWTKAERLRAMEAPGRGRTRSHGSFVAGDLAELKKTIVLCPGCYHKFDWKRHGYYPVWKYEHFNVNSNCDACRMQSDACRMYLHDSNVNRAIVTRDDSRRIRRHAIIVGG